ncbi:MAG: ATP-dependent zinc protease [Planctomycetaceae bacterium]|nr:ATP-dependent zinc protease [Planctomycetaceae bacterium]
MALPESHPVIGWREWVALPDLEVPALKAKIDTGARTSALHAQKIEEFRKGSSLWVRFQIQPLQRDRQTIVEATAPLLEYRHVRSSNGQLEHRAVISTTIALLGRQWPIEVTLSDRKDMGFRMLLGREAVRDRFFVDPGRSFLGGKKPQTEHERHLASLRKRRAGRRSD